MSTNNNNNVIIKEAVLVAPAEPTPTRTLTLSVLDSQLFLRFTIEYLLIYKPSGACDRRATAARLKHALAHALVPYYPLAGRVVTRRPRAAGRLQVTCRGQGAAFVEAEARHVAASDFERAPKRVAQWRGLLSLHVADVLSGGPLVVVQLTWLHDGALALGVGINHCVADGIGSAEFLNRFAELASGPVRPGLTKPGPVWDRHLLDPRDTRTCHNNLTMAHPEFDPVQDVSNFNSRFENEALVPTTTTFTKSSLAELKNRLGDGSHDYTTFEVLTAHVWRSWARSLNLTASQTLKLLFSVNIRNRVEPELPTGYYGNAFVLACAVTSAGDVEEKGLGHVAGLVRAAKRRVGDGHVRSVVKALTGSTLCPDLVGTMIVSQWTRLGLEGVDFGMGRPVNVGPVCTDRYCYLVPVLDGDDGLVGGVRVVVAVPSNAVDKYEYLVRNQRD